MNANNPTRFEAQLWTLLRDGELWACIMLDGAESGSGCAFGTKKSMEEYAARLNECKGILSPATTTQETK